jgi:hypothetical protein
VIKYWPTNIKQSPVTSSPLSSSSSELSDDSSKSSDEDQQFSSSSFGSSTSQSSSFEASQTPHSLNLTVDVDRVLLLLHSTPLQNRITPFIAELFGHYLLSLVEQGKV